jgi:hypothetical protein
MQIVVQLVEWRQLAGAIFEVFGLVKTDLGGHRQRDSETWYAAARSMIERSEALHS